MDDTRKTIGGQLWETSSTDASATTLAPVTRQIGIDVPHRLSDCNWHRICALPH